MLQLLHIEKLQDTWIALNLVSQEQGTSLVAWSILASSQKRCVSIYGWTIPGSYRDVAVFPDREILAPVEISTTNHTLQTTNK